MGLVVVLVASILATGIAYFAANYVAAPGGGASLSTLGNQERQDIQGANEWVEGNIDFWLESHLYDAEVRIDAGSSASTVPDQIDVAMSFFFGEKNAVVIDWTQDWHVTLNSTDMFWTQTSAPAGAPFKCTTPPNIVSIPVNGKSILVPQSGSICIQDVTAHATGNPTTGWVNLMGLPIAQLNSAVPRRNEPCTTVVNGLCSPGAELESSPAKEHFFRLSLVNLFSSSGLYPQSWWPKLPAGKSIGVYFRNHLAITPIWKVALGGPGGGSQPEFCITTGPGALRNTNYNRCSWTTVSREGAGGAQGSKNHGDLLAPGIGQKTIPLPQVVSPTGFLTVCKIVTAFPNDQTGAQGSLTNGWSVHVQGPFGISLTKTTGSDGTGCSKFGPLFPAKDYQVSETLQAGYTNIGVVVNPAADRNVSYGSNPNPSNPVNVSLTFAEAQAGSGPTVTFVNFLPAPGLDQSCSVQIVDANGAVPSRTYAIAGDTVTFTYTVTNTGNVALTVTQTHTNTVRFGPNPLFVGSVAGGASHSTQRSTLVVKGDLGTISDTCSATGVDANGNHATAPDRTCSFVVRAPLITFVKHPVAGDNVLVVPGQKLTYTIDVTNGGDAPAIVAISDALDSGQTLLNGGPSTSTGDMPSPAATSPATGADYAAPVTITWTGLSVAAGTSIHVSFRVLVTATVDGFQLTGTMTLTATNENGVDYSPSPNTAQNLVTVTRAILKLTEFGYTNTPKGTPHQGVVSGITNYTVSFKNFGTDTAVLTGLLNVTVLGAGSGTWVCSTPDSGVSLVGCALRWTDISVAPGATVSFHLTFDYTDLADGAVVSAGLIADYTVPPSDTVYTPSGCPARIEFTIQSD